MFSSTLTQPRWQPRSNSSNALRSWVVSEALSSGLAGKCSHSVLVVLHRQHFQQSMTRGASKLRRWRWGYAFHMCKKPSQSLVAQNHAYYSTRCLRQQEDFWGQYLSRAAFNRLKKSLGVELNTESITSSPRERIPLLSGTSAEATPVYGWRTKNRICSISCIWTQIHWQNSSG